LFEFSDSHSDDLTETEHAYVRIEGDGSRILVFAAILVVLAGVGLVALRRKRGAS
ncbi:MAG TPA: hypothetical protein HA349_03860, partial [Methanotrichaceae archaeon]|nr:hypothetical protein [Methanotrichaceae archaeon]